MQGGILGNDRIVGNTVGVSLTFAPRSRQTSSNKSTTKIFASGHDCVKWNMQTKQWKCWKEISSLLKMLHKSKWLVYGIKTALNLYLTLSVSCFVSDFKIILFHLKFGADRRFNCSHKEHVSRLYFHSDSKAAAGWLRLPLCSAVRMSLLSLIAPAGFYSIDFKIDVLHRCKERELQPSSSPEAPRGS